MKQIPRILLLPLVFSLLLAFPKPSQAQSTQLLYNGAKLVAFVTGGAVVGYGLYKVKKTNQQNQQLQQQVLFLSAQEAKRHKLDQVAAVERVDVDQLNRQQASNARINNISSTLRLNTNQQQTNETVRRIMQAYQSGQKTTPLKNTSKLPSKGLTRKNTANLTVVSSQSSLGRDLLNDYKKGPQYRAVVVQEKEQSWSQRFKSWWDSW